MNASTEYVAPESIEVSKLELCAAIANWTRYGNEDARPLVAPAWSRLMSVMVDPVLVTVSWTVPYRYDTGELVWLTVEVGGGVGFLVGFGVGVLVGVFVGVGVGVTVGSVVGVPVGLGVVGVPVGVGSVVGVVGRGLNVADGVAFAPSWKPVTTATRLAVPMRA
jgi:hypothetical protein